MLVLAMAVLAIDPLARAQSQAPPATPQAQQPDQTAPDQAAPDSGGPSGDTG